MNRSAGDQKLFAVIVNVLRRKHYSLKTERSYLSWIKRFIGYHHMRHPRDMSKHEIESFLTHLAVDRKVASSTQNQAFNAILFLYRDVLEIDLMQDLNAVRAKKQTRIPVVLSHKEAMKVINSLTGVHQTMAKLLYGCGLRLMAVSYTHLRAHETVLDLVCRLLLEKKKQSKIINMIKLDRR